MNLNDYYSNSKPNSNGDIYVAPPPTSTGFKYNSDSVIDISLKEYIEDLIDQIEIENMVAAKLIRAGKHFLYYDPQTGRVEVRDETGRV